MQISKTIRLIRKLLCVFVFGLIISGVTALPIGPELEFIVQAMRRLEWQGALPAWLERVHAAVRESNAKYPFLSYGTDWLAFAHIVIAVAFLGPLRDPVKNKWVVEFGILACGAVLPWAFISGEIREIPWLWRLFDCFFGIAGGALLIVCYFNIQKLEALKESK